MMVLPALDRHKISFFLVMRQQVQSTQYPKGITGVRVISTLREQQ